MWIRLLNHYFQSQIIVSIYQGHSIALNSLIPMEERWAGGRAKSKKNKATALLKIASSQRKEAQQEEEQKVKKHKATILSYLMP